MAAIDRLKSMTAWASEPTLSIEELEELLLMFQCPDSEGRLPADDDYVPTYRMRAAAAEGWRWKSAKAAEQISTDLDGDRMSANQLFEHCQRMIKTYSSPVTIDVG